MHTKIVIRKTQLECKDGPTGPAAPSLRPKGPPLSFPFSLPLLKEGAGSENHG